ncbi:MAG: PhnD/SsuA/transferrin family substrate-binding protein [Gammaproteobacteria bacterium]|nr:PhnD/SsuA/transferrin family substrate-binding protein [Gammaproteobacteria bacterium]MBL6998296.1 PhnD/SsuA/transferrin family substrate-binding protein [Gammaproteobacteria bacterium]
MKILSVLLLYLMLHTPLQAASVSIAVLAYDGKPQALSRWQPTADYLSRQITDHQFHIVALSHAEFEHAINKGELDFILTNPSHYIRLEVKFGVTRIATFLYQFQQTRLEQFSAVIFTRASSELTELQQLRGRSLAAVNEDAFGGFQLAQDALLSIGIDPLQEMTVKWLGFPHADVVRAVLAGNADVGTVRSGILEKMAEQGEIELSQLRILAPQQHAAFPLLHSVDLYPEWAFAKLPATDTALSKQLALALLLMKEDDDAALRAAGAGWTIPLNYDAVHAVLRRLQVEPYQPVSLDFSSFWLAYRHWLVIIILLVLISLATLIRLYRTNQHLQSTQLALQRHQEQLEDRIQLRTEELNQTNLALQNKIESHINVDNSLSDSCELAQSLYDIFMRDELNRTQKLCLIVDALRLFLGTEQALVSSYQGGRFSACDCSPATASSAVQLSIALSQQAIDTQQLVFQQANADWHRYIACPVMVDPQQCYLFEFGTAAQYPLDNLQGTQQLNSALSFKMLHLVAQWISQEILLIEQQQRSDHQLLTLKQRLADLTPREKEVLQLLTQGESTKEMARIMAISSKTVDMHRANLLRKSKAKSSTELVQLAVSSGFFEEPSKNTV